MAQLHQDDDNDLISDLTCAICQELYYQPVTLIMCLHVFCASCYSQHLARQRDCPICREEVIGVRRNHTMAKIVNVYLRLNPSMERSQSDKQACDLINVINGSIDFSSDGSTRSMAVRDRRYLMYPVPCRSCHEDNDTGYTCPHPIPVNNNASIAPSLPTSWDIPIPTGHLRCYDCERFMPARYENGEPNLLQACSFCKRTYCHLYWGCEQPERSHLGKLADVPVAQIFELSASESNFNAPECLNDVERQFLRQYLASGGATLDQMWAKCMSLLDNGDYVCSR
ncbi:hypothetical protein BGW37DRAFT_502665 [Umbelopsis sp. PMI_123]|nr:hypothetical protein BGW37DRAFT_502665 [Umbelopsis sp. PMI_123]